jgi:transcriptional regulator CBF1
MSENHDVMAKIMITPHPFLLTDDDKSQSTNSEILDETNEAQKSEPKLEASSSMALRPEKTIHRIRRESHREVERRRRTAINEGIKELDSLLPEDDSALSSSKGAVIKRAISYIKQLKQTQAQLQQENSMYRVLMKLGDKKGQHS